MDPTLLLCILITSLCCQASSPCAKDMAAPGSAYQNKVDEDEIGARKRVFIPGYSGFVHRLADTFAGTYATCSRDSHYLAYKGNHPAMQKPSLANPDDYYARPVRVMSSVWRPLLATPTQP